MSAHPQIVDWLTEHLSPYRVQHSLGVAATARELAVRYGVDPDQAELAGLLHDTAREWDDAKLLAAAGAAGMPIGYLEELAPMACLHGPLGAELARDTFDVDDDAVLDAIGSHTMGRERMTALEKVVFMADAIEPNRPDKAYVRELRRLAPVDLDRACQRAYDHTFTHLLERGEPLHPTAVKARNWLIYEARAKAREHQEA